jgi:endonuclease/exonuclease/phosphatase family metal-dependent hydrolase
VHRDEVDVVAVDVERHVLSAAMRGGVGRVPERKVGHGASRHPAHHRDADASARPPRRDVVRPRLDDPAPERCRMHGRATFDCHDVDLVAVHLSSRLPYAPPLQLLRLRRQLPPRERRTVLVGDFNLWGPAVSAMLPGWRRAVRGRTWPAHRPHSQIDHVLVRDDIEVMDAAVLDEVGSDHRPVRVTLRLR